MKIGLVVFHKNIKNIYEQSWIDRCISSINLQTFTDYKVYEINYGGDADRLFQTSVFFSIKKLNYADAMNFIITEAFNDGCDYVFNINLDDYYSTNRIEKQIEHLNKGFHIVSSDFCTIDEKDKIITHLNIKKFGDIKYCLDHNHNVIAHPSVAYHRKFWEDTKNRYDVMKAPTEDLDLWKRAINRGYSFYIDDEVLLYHRIHKNKASNTDGRV